MDKRVLIIITTGMVSWGGLTTVAMNYYRAMDKRNLQIDFASDFSMAEPWLIQEIEDHGGKCIPLPPKREILQYTRKILPVLKGYDVVHVHGNSGTMAVETVCAKLQGVRMIIVHGHNTQCDHVRANRILKPIMLRLSDCRLACSEEAGYWLYGIKNYTVLNNAIPVERYAFDPETRKRVRKEWGAQNNTHILGHVGKINKQKNHCFLVEIFREYHRAIPDSKLVLVGDGELRPKIEKQVREWGLDQDVIFVGMRTDPEKWIQGMDYFVFPSIYEGFPLALTEAQANGLPCLISNTIAEKVRILPNLKVLDLKDGPAKWAETICEMPRERISNEKVKERFREEHLSILEEAENLRNIYLQ